MGTAHVEIVAIDSKNNQFPGQFSQGGNPLLVADEITSTTATTAGSRITAPSVNRRDMYARIIHDEACYVMIGSDPTAAVPPALCWKTVPNVALVVPIRAGEKISFKEVA